MTSLDRCIPASLYGPARRRWTPRAAGRVPGSSHLALTFDDGPDPVSTPCFLDLLDRAKVHATFFLVGSRAAEHPEVVRTLHDAGHEVAVHGWTHRGVVRSTETALTRELARTVTLLEDLTGTTPQWYRPPYGVLTVHAVRAARSNGLTPVLWTAWGREWTRRASVAGVTATVRRTARPGGTVLLHDTDAYAVPGSWHHSLGAAAALLETWHAERIAVGTVTAHLGPPSAGPPTRCG